jgi:hypothetical protein
MRKNFRSDITIIEHFYDYNGSNERVPAPVPSRVRIEYFTAGSPLRKLTCSRNGDNFQNCSLSPDGKSLICHLALSRTFLGEGPLLKVVRSSANDGAFPESTRNTEWMASTGVDLWKGPSDAGEMESESVLSDVILRDGYSAYRLAVLNGFEGTEEQWLASLVGPAGASAYAIAVQQGFVGTKDEWLASLVGPTGNGIQSVEQTTESQESGGENVVTVTMTDGTVATFRIRNGQKGVPGVANARYKQVADLPEAGAGTMDYIYLTPSGTAGVYNLSYTEQDGNTYSWKDLGTTAIQLSDYATKQEVSQLSTEINGGEILGEEINSSPYQITDQYLYTTGWINNAQAQGYVVALVPVVPGSRYRVEGTGRMAFLRNNSTSNPVAFCVGYEETFFISSVGTRIGDGVYRYDFNAPNDCHYVYIVIVGGEGQQFNTKIYPFVVIERQVLKGEDCVDSLLSSSTNKPLAAKQGQVLNEKISELDSSEIDPASLVVVGYGWIGPTNLWATQTARTGSFIPVLAGQKIMLVSDDEHSTYYAFLTEGASSVSAGGTPPFVDETERFMLLAGQSATITIPQGCTHLQLGRVYDETDCTPAKILILGEISRIKNSTAETKEFIDGRVVEVEKELSRVPGTYVNVNTGKWNADPDAESAFVPAIPGETYRIVGRGRMGLMKNNGHVAATIAEVCAGTEILFIQFFPGAQVVPGSDNYECTIVAPGDCRYIYLQTKGSAGTILPKSVYSLEREYDYLRPSDVGEIDGGIEIAIPQTPPRAYQGSISPEGKLVQSETSLVTARIYGDFFVVLREGYQVKRICLVDRNGKVVNYNFVQQYPISLMDSTALGGRRMYGKAWMQPYYGCVLEIIRDDSGQLSPSDDLFESFYWKDSQLFSELETLEKYRGETATGTTVDTVVYEKGSIRSALIRARMCAMIPLLPLRDILPTQDNWIGLQFLAGTRNLGVPYSRASVRDRWFGLNVSPYTFLTSMLNPYSVIYTEVIGGNTGSESRSEYGQTYNSGHGRPYYGLVCSSYGSFIYGFKYPIITDGFPRDNRNIIVSRHGDDYIPEPINARTIPALCTITTPGHTWCVIDFLCDGDGNRIAAIVAEETTPCVRAGLYPIDRLQTRFNSEYAGNHAGVTEVTIVKPTILYDNRNVNLWDVSRLYNINTIPGQMTPSYGVDPNVLFYMGDKAVVMEPDANATRNDDCWLIVKPEGTYSKIRLEVWNITTQSWDLVSENIDIATLKQSYSDGNEDYYKINLTAAGYCQTRGKYRACLTDGDGTLTTGYTQWIVLNGTIQVDPNNSARIVWSSMNELVSQTEDEFAAPIAALFTPSGGEGGNNSSGEAQAITGYLIGQNGRNYPYVKVDFRCAWGTGMRMIPNPFYNG